MNFKSVCIRPSYVPRCASKLRDSSVLVCTVIGFHEGTQPTDEKVAYLPPNTPYPPRLCTNRGGSSEAKQCTADGAHELDMVLNYPLLLSTPPEYAGCYADVRAVRDAAPAPTVLKAILETSQLSVAQIVAASVIAVEAGVDFVKTSTGFRGGGATEEHVRVMRWVAERHGQGRVGVKASGGVRTLADAEGMIRAGASRIGTSGGVGIVRQAEERAGAEGGGVRGS